MSFGPISLAAYAAARERYHRRYNGDALEFELEMDADLPAELLLCELHDAFVSLTERFRRWDSQLPREVGNEDLVVLITEARRIAEQARQAFRSRFVLDPPA